MMHIHYFDKDPGIQWKKDPDPVIKADSPLDSHWVLTPNVVPLVKNGYRLYYTGVSQDRFRQGCLGYILSAFSHDGLSWQKEHVIHIDTFMIESAVWIFCPEVIPIPGGWRMYFQVKTSHKPDYIGSATSIDGLKWTIEPGARLESRSYHYGSPRCLRLTEYEYRLYFHRYDLFDISRNACIMYACSLDGTTFEINPEISIAQTQPLETYAVYAAEVLQTPHNFRMYYAGWSSNPTLGRIFSATSSNGIEWKKDSSIVINCGGINDTLKASEPCVYQLSSCQFKMLYEACNQDGKWCLASATSTIK